jgi:putative lipoic acid-binding regulatory protein
MNDASPLKFPCDFPIKIMGHASDRFEQQVVSIVRRHAPDLGEGAVRTRSSAAGNYLAVTVTVRATSREQLDELYRELHACEQVVMLL